jgi:predicted amino acid-binding ACT domain protein
VPKVIDNLNGVAVAYAVGATNALLAVLFSFGVNVTDDQRSAIVGFVNAALVLTAHLSHVQAQRSQAKLDAAANGETGTGP